MAADPGSLAKMPATTAQDVQILLQAISHPELGDIPIEDDLFPIGRTETPFASFPPDLVNALSRRHARIFYERGLAYIADLGSKNGTTVNSIPVRERPSRLKDGDEICLGGEFSYRVRLAQRQEKPASTSRIVGLTLTPDRNDLGLQPIVINSFPFLVSKADENFARYREQYPHQVNYISRRHAHIFLKGGQPYVEDLGSTNGTFVSGNRLEEHAVRLQEDDQLAFGGHHFVYRVSLQKEKVQDPTVTRIIFPNGAEQAVDSEKTTFVAAADSFLDIFCVDEAPPPEEEVNPEEGKATEETGKESGRKRGKVAVFASELTQAFSGGEREGLIRYVWWGAGALGLLLLVAGGIYLRGAPEREIRTLLTHGDYAQAATAADQHLAGHPDNTELKSLGTEAVLKSHVPTWVAQVKARDFKGAAGTLGAMKAFAAHNPDVASLVGEFEWIGNLEQFYGSRGGSDAPIRIYGDEERITGLLKPWEEDPQGHQRAFDRVSSYVPEFGDFYAMALSHLRKIQSDDSVYVAAIDRLKSTITTELNKGHPEALEETFKEYGEKYPRLGGLDALREDLRRYREIEDEIQARRPGRVAALLAGARFATPPFQAKIQALGKNGQLPQADVLKQYEAVAAAWREGKVETALAGLQAMEKGPWADTARRDSDRKKAIAEQFARLQNARGSKGYDEQLLSFYDALDPDEDTYFLQAITADLTARRDKVLKHGQDLLSQAQSRWNKYRENGGIADPLRTETSVSGKFRSQSGLLAEAQAGARQGLRTYAFLKTDVPAQWSKLSEEINSEAELQRRSLLELGSSLEPGLLKTKLALLGGNRE